MTRRRRTLRRGRYRRRHPTQLTPRDFDLSPYFEIVKFNLVQERKFDYSRIEWAPEVEPEAEDVDFEKEVVNEQ